MDGGWEKEAYNGDNPLHPCQKPLPLMAWLVNGLTAPDHLVCDPFMGSGTTGVACIRTGRKFIGIEIDAGHFATARARLENELRQGLLPLKHNKALSDSAH
jgi:DNA modification methylase